MSDGKIDEIKGRAKQTVGDVTGDEDLKRSGEKDEAVGKAKQAVEDVEDTVKKGVDRVTEVFHKD
jgi:uncharacterized protein YjbJ (UPF0337 family)